MSLNERYFELWDSSKQDLCNHSLELEKELAKLKAENEKLRFQLDVAEAVLSVQVTKSALAYFEDKIKSLENNVTEH